MNRRHALGTFVIAFALAGGSSAHAQDADIRPSSTTPDTRPAANAPNASFDIDAAMAPVPGGLTAGTVAARAVETAPSMEAARAALRQAEEGAARAWLAVLPRVDLSASYTRLSEVDQASLFSGLTPEQEAMARTAIAAVADPAAAALFTANLDAQLAQSGFSFPQILDQFALQATVSYPLSDLFFSILPAYDAATELSEAQRAQIDVQRENIALQAVEAYYALSRARGTAFVARASVEQADARRRDIEAFVNAGTAARVDLMRVDAQIAALRVGVARADGGVAIASAAVRNLLHIDDGEELRFAEDFSTELPPIEGTKEALIVRALDNRAEIRAFRRVVSARQRLVGVRRSGGIPHLAVQAAAVYANPNQRIVPSVDEFRASWSVGAVLTWSPNDLLGANSDASAANAELAKAQADLAALEDGLRLEVTQAYENVVAARAAIEAARAGVAAAEESYRVRVERFRAGSAVTSDVLDSEAELSRARLDVINTAIDLRIANARLRRAVGLPSAAE